MKAVLFREKNTPLQYTEVPKPVPAKGQVLVKLHSAALNHRDLWIQKEQNSPAAQGIILGSDGSGVIEDVADDVDESLIGQAVVINPSIGWGKNPHVQADSFRILGLPDSGTFSEYIAISRKQVVDMPEGLTFEEAAALPLSGLTAYRALFTKARLRPGEKILITGIGGGAALLALVFAVGFKAIPFVTSGSTSKLELAKSFGAKGGFNYKDSTWLESAKREDATGFDVIIDSAGGDQFASLLDVAMPGGRIVNFGKTSGAISGIPPRTLYWKQLSVLGTTMGTEDEFLSMLDFVHKHKIKPVIDSVFPLDQINEAFSHMSSEGQFGKIVLRIA